MQVKYEELLLGHRRLIAIQTVDCDRAYVLLVHTIADAVAELAGRQFRGLQLLNKQRAVLSHRLEVDAEIFRAREQKPELLVENEETDAIAALDTRCQKLQREKRLSGARRSNDEGARPSCETSAEQRIQLHNPALHNRSCKAE